MERGDSGDTKENNEETKDNTTDPLPLLARQAEADLDSDDNSIMSDTETDSLKYLAPKYKKSRQALTYQMSLSLKGS